MGICCDCKKPNGQCKCGIGSLDTHNINICDYCLGEKPSGMLEGLRICSGCYNRKVNEMKKCEFNEVGNLRKNIDELENKLEKYEEKIEVKDMDYMVLKSEYKKVVEQINNYKEMLEKEKDNLDIEIGNYNKLYEEKEIIKKIADSRYKEIEKLKEIIKQYDFNMNKLGELTSFISKNFVGNAGRFSVDVAIELLREMLMMRVINVCQECEMYNLREYINKNGNDNVNIFVKNVLKEECVICEGKMENIDLQPKFEVKEEKKIISENVRTQVTQSEWDFLHNIHDDEYINNNYYIVEEKEEEFIDSYWLVYKVKNMNEVKQINLTKEECEIIYGNLDLIEKFEMGLM